MKEIYGGITCKIEDFLSRQNVKFTLIMTFVMYLLTHMMLFTDRYLNEDDLYVLTTMRTGHIPNGRWFSGNVHEYVTPWFLAVLTAIAMAFVVYMIVDMFKIQAKTSIFLIALSLVTFPSLAYGFSYFFMVEIYAYSMLLAVFAVYITHKHKYGFVLGALALACSIGYYQAYLSTTITLCLMMLIFDIVPSSENIKEMFKKTVKYLVMGAFGVGLYFIFLQIAIYTSGLELSSYRGMSSMGTLPISKIPYLLFRTYQNFINFFIGDRYFYNDTLKIVAYIVIGLSTLFLIFQYLKTLSKTNKVVFCILLPFFPLAINILDFVAHETDTSTLTTFSFALVFVIVVKFIESVDGDKKGIIKSVLLVAIIIVGYKNFYLTNIYYANMSSFTERSIMYYNRLYSRLEETEGFTSDLPILVLGDAISQKAALGTYVNEYSEVILNDQGYQDKIVGTSATSYYDTSVKYKVLLNNLMGCNLTFKYEDFITDFVKNEQIEQMPVYPAEGSIQVIDGILVVNFIETHINASIEQVGDNLELEVSINNVSEPGDYTVAWYVYKDGEILDKIMYESSYTLSYPISGNGQYYVIYFVKDSNGETIKETRTETVEVQ